MPVDPPRLSADGDVQPMSGVPGTAAEAANLPSMGVMGAARELGVAPATLRSWDRRYGLAPSLHTKGGHRRYGPSDMSRLHAMGRMVRSGVPPAEAARAALALSDAELALPVAAPAGSWESDGASSPDLSREPTEGNVVALPASPVRGLTRAAQALDSSACAAILRRSLRERGVVATWEELARPVLASVGARWASSGGGIEVEHAFSAAVSLAFGGYSSSVDRPAATTQTVLLASAPDELHDIPMTVLAAALAEQGIPAVHLGARTPARALVDAITRLRPAALVLWAQDVRFGVAPELPGLRPAPVLILAGPGWSAAPTRAPVVADLAGALDRISSALGLAPASPAVGHSGVRGPA